MLINACLTGVAKVPVEQLEAVERRAAELETEVNRLRERVTHTDHNVSPHVQSVDSSCQRKLTTHATVTDGG